VCVSERYTADKYTALCLSVGMSVCLSVHLCVSLSVCVSKDQDSTEPELSDWERYAAEEYELLVAEEGATDAQHDDASVQHLLSFHFSLCFLTHINYSCVSVIQC